MVCCLAKDVVCCCACTRCIAAQQEELACEDVACRQRAFPRAW